MLCRNQYLQALVLCAGLTVSAALTAAAQENDPIRQALQSVVGVRAHIPADARTAGSLGQFRQGNGVLIDDDGLVLTIGYLILEAERVNVVRQNGEEVPAKLVAYDHNTGFGLVRAEDGLGGARPARFGSSSSLAEGEGVLSVALGGPAPILPVRVVSRRKFAGYWEYLLPDAIFTAPPQPFFGGSPLFNRRGRLVGVGSLTVNDAAGPGEGVNGNMYVPIDELKPILAAMLETGRGSGPRTPWLGVYTGETNGRVFVSRVASGGPAEAAGIAEGDQIIGVSGRKVSSVREFLERVWMTGPAGTEISLDVLPGNAREVRLKRVTVRSKDRYDWLRLTGP